MREIVIDPHPSLHINRHQFSKKKSISHDSEPIENSPVSMVIYFNFPPLYLRFLEGCTLLNALISTELFGIISN